MPGNIFGVKNLIGDPTDFYGKSTLFGWLKRLGIFIGAVPGGFSKGFGSGFAVHIDE